MLNKKLSARSIFLVIVVLLLGAGLVGWKLYDLKVRQPRLAEMREIYQTWKQASTNADSARAQCKEFQTEMEAAKKPEERVNLEGRYNNARAVLTKYEKRRDTAERTSLGQYGVPAGELPRLLGE